MGRGVIKGRIAFIAETRPIAADVARCVVSVCVGQTDEPCINGRNDQSAVRDGTLASPRNRARGGGGDWRHLGNITEQSVQYGLLSHS